MLIVFFVYISYNNNIQNNHYISFNQFKNTLHSHFSSYQNLHNKGSFKKHNIGSIQIQHMTLEQKHSLVKNNNHPQKKGGRPFKILHYKIGGISLSCHGLILRSK